MQAYVTSTVSRLAALELDGHPQHGRAHAARQVGLFVALPLGAYLAGRFSRSGLLLTFTGVAILGTSVGAVTPRCVGTSSPATFHVGRHLMSPRNHWTFGTLSLSQSQSPSLRPPDLDGPLRCRWSSPRSLRSCLPLTPCCQRELSSAAADNRRRLRLSISGRVRLYFGASAVTAIVGHDVSRLIPAGIGLLLTLGGLGWAVVGFVRGRHPSPDDHALVFDMRCRGIRGSTSLGKVALTPCSRKGDLSVGGLCSAWALATTATASAFSIGATAFTNSTDPRPSPQYPYPSKSPAAHTPRPQLAGGAKERSSTYAPAGPPVLRQTSEARHIYSGISTMSDHPSPWCGTSVAD